MLKNIHDKNTALMIKESFTSKEKDEPSILAVLKQIKLFVNFEKMQELILEELFEAELHFLFLNYLLPLCKNLKKFSLYNNLLSNVKLSGVDLSLVSSTLESFDIGLNKNIDDLSFLDGLFKSAKNLKILKMSSV